MSGEFTRTTSILATLTNSLEYLESSICGLAKPKLLVAPNLSFFMKQFPVINVLILFFFIYAIETSGQKAPIKFGNIPEDDLRMTVYNKDSSAEAVILADYGESALEYNKSAGFMLEFERVKRIKILTKEGYGYADFSIPLYKSGSDEETLSGLKAATYNLEAGKIIETKMKNEAVFKEKRDDNVDVVKFTLPNVKEGSIVEVTYKVRSPFVFNFQDWDFQSTIPTRWSEYRARYPEYFEYKRYAQGYITLPIQEHSTEGKTITLGSRERTGLSSTYETEQIPYAEHHYRWACPDVPAFKEEPYMTTYRDFISRMNFELAYVLMPNSPVKSYSSSWEEIAKNMLESESFGGVVKASGFLREAVTQLTANASEPADKVAAIYSYIKQNVAWDGTSRKYPSKSLRKIVEEKKGNSADLNLLLVAMLQRAELDAAPFLISTRDHGFIRTESPAAQQFNYVLAYVQLNEKYLLLDATNPSLPINVLPANCLNGQGYLVSDKGGWIKIHSSAKSKSVLVGNLMMQTDGKLAGKVEFVHEGYEALRARKAIAKDGESEYGKAVASTFGWESRSQTLANMNVLHEPIKEQYEVSLEEYVQTAGDVIYLNPILGYRINETPFRSENREYPVDFGSPQERLVSIKIKLADGLTVEETPQPKAMALPNRAGRFNYSVVHQNGNELMITNHFIINQPLFPQTEYELLREFYAMVVAKQAEQIVLKRK